MCAAAQKMKNSGMFGVYLCWRLISVRPKRALKMGEVFGCPFQLSTEQRNDNYQITEVQRLTGLKQDTRFEETTLFEKGIEQI